MNKVTRRLRRETAKRLYKQFCVNWRATTREQDKLDEQGNRHRISESRLKRHAERGHPILGKRPSFKQWWAAVQTTEQAKEASPEEVAEHIEELSWDDE